jgi:type IX secretion system PorP/SprF family membrane protein
MKKTNRLTLLLSFFAFLGYAQDMHFSFAEMTPLSINPALAGANYEMEGMLNYRNQWSSIGAPFSTVNAAIHGRVSNTTKRPSNWLCMGLQVTADKAGAPSISNNGISLSIADQIKVGRYSRIGLGLHAGFGQRSLRASEGRWGNQYDGAKYNSSIPSGEGSLNISKSYPDIGVGVVYTYQKRKGAFVGSIDKLINIGFSAFHVNRPDFGFLQSENAKLPIRFTFFSNAEFAINNGGGALMPAVYIFRQGSFSEYLFGGFYKYKVINASKYTGFVKPFSISFGVFGRANDAAVIKILADYYRYSLGYSFDVNTSGLSTFTRGRGAHEVVLRFVMM